MNAKQVTRLLACLLAVVLCISLSGCGDAPVNTANTTTVSTTVTTTATTTINTTTTTEAAGTPNASAGNYAAALDPTYQRLLLVNASHPLPDDFDNTDELTTIPDKYRNGSLNQIDEGIYPYVMAMLQAAWADGVNLYVRSPYRSYATQQYLFNNKVQNVIKAGTPKDQAEAVAATAVARPGTSEHQTGLAIDFNTASSKFENTPAHLWMLEHAEDYGFILRYPADKTEITGVMYEPWHWRFVGINTAKEINQLGVVFEEYMAMQEPQPE